MTAYIVQRKVIAWEEVIVEADSIEEAVDKSYDLLAHEWQLLEDYETTDDFWVKNLETQETKLSIDGFLKEAI